jgi:hypothetical protein
MRTVAIITSILATQGTARANDPLCHEIHKGDIAACQAKAARDCTDSDAWARHVCETRIALGFEQCRSDAFTKAVTAAARLVRIADAFENLASDWNVWADNANHLERNIDDYTALARDWKVCPDDRHAFDDDSFARVRNAPEAYKKSFAKHIDFHLQNARVSMTSTGVDKAAGKPGFAMNDWYLKQTNELIELEDKLPASMRYKEDELKALLVQSDANDKALKGWIKQQIANRRCPSGQPLEQPFLAVAKSDSTDDKGWTRTVYRHSAPRHQDRDGLISRDNVPVVMCSRHAPTKTDPEFCLTTNLTVYREKPPGGVWTSWQLAVGSSEEFNCSKF